jgi:hypothetical protein
MFACEPGSDRYQGYHQRIYHLQSSIVVMVERLKSLALEMEAVLQVADMGVHSTGLSPVESVPSSQTSCETLCEGVSGSKAPSPPPKSKRTKGGKGLKAPVMPFN